MSDDAVGYADAMAELGDILDELERDDLDVDVLAERVKRASELIKLCRTRIARAQADVDKIVIDLESFGTANSITDEGIRWLNRTPQSPPPRTVCPNRRPRAVGTARDRLVRRHARRRHAHAAVRDRRRRVDGVVRAGGRSSVAPNRRPRRGRRPLAARSPEHRGAVATRHPDRADVVAADLLRFFDGAGGPFSLFCPWPTSLPGLPARAPAVPAPRAGRRAAPHAARAHDRGSHHREGLGDYEQVLVDGFPLESLQPWRAGVVFHPATLHFPGTRFFVGRVDGRAVSVATSIVGCGVNHVEFVATLPDARGRGYGAAVTWEATLAEPKLPALLIATDMGRPVYERMGYVALTRWTFLVGER